jgi:hypothetical protein
LSGPEVRRLLVNTARQLGPSGRVLDVDAALAATRRKLLLDTLQNESLEIQQILAETGLRPEVAMPLIDDLIESNTVTPVRIGDVETLEYRSGLPQ